MDCAEFVEVDPTGRYGRYDEILGRGASKTVYRGFDEYEGIEVAWNQVKLYELMQSPGDLERLYCEIHLLKTLKHDNIMNFYTSWVDSANRNINFVTEIFTSGTLRQYRLKHRRVNIRAVKHWCRQILRGLHYLHTHDPPVIHRDLKCDNIFINGNQGQVKIGDLGLAAVLRKSHAACCVGTPEFMAPEVYEEEYNELVDIYSFGMCILEMITFEYPYSECTHPAQIYKKVISGQKPESLYKVQNPAVRAFVEKCLASVSCRLTAMELLNDPFLQIDDRGSDFWPLECHGGLNQVHPLLRQPAYAIHDSTINGYSNDLTDEHGHNWDYDQVQCKLGEIDLFPCQEDENLMDADITIKGRRREDDGIFLRLRLADKEGRIRNIYFPFDIEKDTALSVATEMVAELDINDHDVTKIADMIDVEIATLVPEWNKGFDIDESHHGRNVALCHDCASNDSLVDYVSSNNVGAKNLQVIQCSNNGCAAVHGRFEEIMYKVDRSEHSVTQVKSGQENGNHYADIWAQRNAPEVTSKGSGEMYCSETHDRVDQPNVEGEKIINMDNSSESYVRNSIRGTPSAAFAPIDDYENEIRRELRWLKAKYQLQLRELADQQLRVKSKPSISSPHPQDRNDADHSLSSVFTQLKMEDYGRLLTAYSPRKHYSSYFSLDSEKRSTDEASPKVEKGEEGTGSYSPEQITMTAKSFYTGDLLPYSLNRATSLPVDAVDV